MSFLETVSQTSLVRWVAESDFGYPTVLTMHAIGMALVVGIVLVFDLRVLGLASRIPLVALKRFFLIAWLGFAVNLTSGTLLFCANYTAFIHNTAFLTKISLLVAGAVCTALLAREIGGSAATATSKAKWIAGVSVILWLGAITAGRIVGYTSVPE